MSYQVIARKWRPQTFEEVTGQEHITQTLRNALEYDRLHHAYLFSGARGVGKTTSARLLAKALNCHKTKDKPNLTPCRLTQPDVCPSCLEISESRSMDVLEIDAASHTGIDDVRDTIIENITVNPARDRYKVFIIDEVHQLSKQAFNALLKTLEEPPPNVVFIMATTELHKVPETILSRCQQFEFRTIPVQKIFERLKLIAESEKIEVSDEALREISRSGEGSMRDAQSNFDQVISFSGEKITLADVSNALGIASVEMLTAVMNAIRDRNAKQVLTVVDDLISRGQDLRNFSRDLLSLFRDLLVFKIAGNAENMLETSMLSRDEMQTHAAAFSESDLIRFFNALAETESKLKDAVQSRFVLEIGLIKLVEMRNVASVESIIERLAALQGSTESGQPVEGSGPKAKPSDEESKTEEKKTLSLESVPEIRVASSLNTMSEQEITADPDTKTANGRAYDLGFLDSIRVSLPAIASEDLEHIDDTWLDTAFEAVLLRSGDDLTPIRDALKIVENALVSVRPEPNQTTDGIPASSSGGTAIAFARENPILAPPVFVDESDAELPELSADPTEEELFAYARAHPLVKKALRIFRGKVISVKKV